MPLGRKDFRVAFGWYQKAADAGNSDAQQNLGMLYESGQGVMKNYKAAAQWYSTIFLKG